MADSSCKQGSHPPPQGMTRVLIYLTPQVSLFVLSSTLRCLTVQNALCSQFKRRYIVVMSKKLYLLLCPGLYNVQLLLLIDCSTLVGLTCLHFDLWCHNCYFLLPLHRQLGILAPVYRIMWFSTHLVRLRTNISGQTLVLILQLKWFLTVKAL